MVEKDSNEVICKPEKTFTKIDEKSKQVLEQPNLLNDNYKSFKTKEEFEEAIAAYIAENIDLIKEIISPQNVIDFSEIEKNYGEIDKETVSANKEFNALIEKGISSLSAYRAVFFDELVKKSEEKGKDTILNSLRSKAGRISEIGVIAKNAPMLKKDPSQMSNDEIEEIRKRVRIGEKVRF